MNVTLSPILFPFVFVTIYFFDSSKYSVYGTEHRPFNI